MEGFTAKKIGLREIKRDPRFSCHFEETCPELEASLRRFGLLDPIWVKAPPDLGVIDGFRRLTMLQALGQDTVEVVFLAGRYSDAEIFLRGLERHRGQSWTEGSRVRVISKALHEFRIPVSEVVQSVLPLLNVPANEKTAMRYWQVARLSEGFQRALDQGRISLVSAAVLSQLSDDDRTAVETRILQPLSLTVSQFALALDWLQDLRRRERKSFSDLLAGLPQRDAGETRGQDRRKDSEDFFYALGRLRYPRLTEVREAFEGVVNRLKKLAPRLRVEADPFFEKPGYSLILRIRDADELEEVIRDLQEQRSLLKSLMNFVI